MSGVTLIWVGDLNRDKRMQASSVKLSDERFRPKTIELKDDQKEIRIGRLNSTNPPHYLIESCINKRMISRNHATIERLSNGGFMLYDHSMNGTYINYMRVSGGVALKNGDIVCFGHLNGANLKPGENVAPFFSDLKYQVCIGNSNQEKDPKKAQDVIVGDKRPHQPVITGKLSSTKEVDEDKASKVSRSSSNENKKAIHSHKSRRVEADAEVDSDDGDLLHNASRRKSTAISSGNRPQKKSSDDRNKASIKKPVLQLSSLPSPTKKTASHPGSSHHQSRDKKSGQSRSSTKKMKIQKNTTDDNDLDLGSGDEPNNYDTDECSARHCKKPQDNEIDWIQCDKCSKWYHQACLGLSSTEANVDVYFCPNCKKK